MWDAKDARALRFQRAPGILWLDSGLHVSSVAAARMTRRREDLSGGRYLSSGAVMWRHGAVEQRRARIALRARVHYAACRAVRFASGPDYFAARGHNRRGPAASCCVQIGAVNAAEAAGPPLPFLLRPGPDPKFVCRGVELKHTLCCMGAFQALFCQSLAW